MIFTGWDTPLGLVKAELVQKEYEGFLVPDTLKDQVAAMDSDRDEMDFAAIDDLFMVIDKLPADPQFTYAQPNDLHGIRVARPAGPRQLGTPTESDLLDKFHGAWIGRAAGCALGKPVENMGIRGQQGMIGRKAIRTYLQNRNDSWNPGRLAFEAGIDALLCDVGSRLHHAIWYRQLGALLGVIHHLGRCVTGAERSDCDTSTRRFKLIVQCLGKGQHKGFGGRIDILIGYGHPGGQRGDIEYMTALS